MLDNIIEWVKRSGLTVLAYAGIAIGTGIMGYDVLFGAASGIFIYVNFNTIKKLIEEAIKKRKQY